MSQYNTGEVSDDDYITVGEAREMGAQLAINPRGGLLAPARPAAPAARLSPAVMQTLRRNVPQVPQTIVRQLAQPGITEARARQLIDEALQQFGNLMAQRYPYGDIPPKPVDGEAMFPMGLGSVTLTSANPTGILLAQPQRAFRGERLVMSVTRSVGAAGIGVFMTDFQIGDYKQLVGGGSLPVDVFAGDAFGVRLMLDGSIPGVVYSIPIAAAIAIPLGESIVVSGAVIGRAGEAPQR